MKLIYLRILVISAFAIALVFNLADFNSGQTSKVAAEEKYESVQIFPAIIDSGGWENIESAKIQDLSEDAIFNEFNTTNSAYIVSEAYRNLHSIASESLPELLPEILPVLEPTLPTSEGVGTPTDSVGAEPELEPISEVTPEPESTSEPELTPEPEVTSEPEVIPDSEVLPQPDSLQEDTGSVEGATTQDMEEETAPEPEANPPSPEETSAPSVFYRFLEEFVFAQAWAQETDTSSDSYKEFLSCDDEGVECLSKSIEFSGFGIADTLVEKPVSNIQLRFSLAGIKENLEDMQAPGRVLVEYFFRNTWSRAGEILMTEEISNSLNGGYFLYALPEIKSWEELDNLKIRISVQYFGDSEMNIFLDGLWLEADTNYEELIIPVPEPLIGQDKNSPFDLMLVSASNSFSSYEIPIFAFDYRRDGGVLDLFSSFLMSLIGKGGIKLSVIDQKTNVGPKVNVDGENFKIEFENSRVFTPGRHRLRMNIYDNGNEYHQEQEFLWGALFINMEKTSYRPGETARLNIEVLDDIGNSVCDVKIQAEIRSGLSRISTFSTESGNIYRSGKCLAGGDKTSASFYLSYQIPPETGMTRIELKAETGNGPRILSGSFDVANPRSVEIIRSAPVHIAPGMEYEVSFILKSDSDFRGIFKEIVPANFEIIPDLTQDSVTPVIEEDSYSRIISWPVSLKAGETSVIRYSFRALNGSMALNVLGPASLENFRELNSWQIVSSGGNRSIMLNDNSVHFCKIEPFSQNVSAGESVRYNISLVSSENNKPFLLSFPGLPPEVAVSLNRGTGPVDDIYADVFVQPDAARGSFNLVMVYQEREDNGAILGTSCQLNLVVE